MTRVSSEALDQGLAIDLLVVFRPFAVRIWLCLSERVFPDVVVIEYVSLCFPMSLSVGYVHVLAF